MPQPSDTSAAKPIPAKSATVRLSAEESVWAGAFAGTSGVAAAEASGVTAADDCGVGSAGVGVGSGVGVGAAASGSVFTSAVRYTVTGSCLFSTSGSAAKYSYAVPCCRLSASVTAVLPVSPMPTKRYPASSLRKSSGSPMV